MFARIIVAVILIKITIAIDVIIRIVEIFICVYIQLNAPCFAKKLVADNAIIVVVIGLMDRLYWFVFGDQGLQQESYYA